ncbi:MAG: ATP-binding protein, partial [Chloroflexi bacterium]|nr:ATP-binding protein [Chloroflexota bacterium]
MATEDSARIVVGREVERAEAAAFLERCARGFGALFLVGEPGIGKTAIWLELLKLAPPRTILVHRASQAEARHSFTGLSDLLGESNAGDLPRADLVTQAIAMLVAPRRHAIEAALLLREADAEMTDARRVGLALLDLLPTSQESTARRAYDARSGPRPMGRQVRGRRRARVIAPWLRFRARVVAHSEQWRWTG